jgi:hypothetical protein
MSAEVRQRRATGGFAPRRLEDAWCIWEPHCDAYESFGCCSRFTSLGVLYREILS